MRIGNGAVWQVVATAASMGLQLVQLSLVTHTLPISDVGVLAVYSTVALIVQSVADFGLSNYIIHKRDLRREELSSLYWLNVLIGTSLFLALCIASAPIATIYNETRIAELISLVGLNFLVLSFGSQFQAVLIKRQKVAIVAKIEIVSKIFGFCFTAWLLLMAELGVQSVPCGLIFASIVKSGSLFLFRGELFYARTFRIQLLREGVSFGLSNVGSQLLNAARTNSDTLVLGVALSQELLGQYSVAKQIAMVPAAFLMPLMSRIAQPVFSRVQHNPELLRMKVNKTYQLNFLITINVYLTLAFVGDVAIRIFAGPTYVEGVHMLVMLSIFYMTRLAFGAPQGPLAQAIGKPGVEFRWNMLSAPVHFAVVFVCASSGIDTLLIGLLVMQCVFSLLSIRFFLEILTGVAGADYIRMFVSHIVRFGAPILIVMLVVEQLALEDVLGLVVRVLAAVLLFVVSVQKMANGWIER